MQIACVNRLLNYFSSLSKRHLKLKLFKMPVKTILQDKENDTGEIAVENTNWVKTPYQGFAESSQDRLLSVQPFVEDQNKGNETSPKTFPLPSQ